MTAAWQSVSAASLTLGSDPVVTKPTGTVDGDLLIAIGTTGASAQTITKPDASWNTHAGSIGAPTPLFWKIASSEPANYTFVVSGTPTSVVQIIRITGHHPTNPIEAAAGVIGTTGSLVITSVTSGGADRLLMQMVCKIQATTFTGPGSQTERYDAQAATASCVYAGGDEVVGSGATGTRTWTPAAGGGNQVGYNLSIVPAPPGAGTFTGAYDFAGSGFNGAAGPGQGTFTGAYDFAGSSWVGAAGPGEGTYAGAYAFDGNFTGAAGPGEGQFAGTYDFAGSDFVGVAGPAEAYGSFTGDYAFDGVFTGAAGPGEGQFAGDYTFDGSFTGVAPPPPPPVVPGEFTPGGRDRFTARRTPKNRRRVR